MRPPSRVRARREETLPIALVLSLAACLSGCDTARGAPPCIPGSTTACDCDAATGFALCAADGTREPCVCDAPIPCVSGRALACRCADGTAGAAICADETLGPCVCETDAGATEPSDAEPSDAGRRAGCDPYAGQTCGCGEPTPPLTPTIAPPPPSTTLGSGPESLVDVLVVPEGVLVVLRDELRLMSRAGGLLARWRSEREITAALRVGVGIVAVDRARVTSLGADLAEQSHFAPAEPCNYPLVASCGRLLCATQTSTDWSRHTYEIATGAELFRDHLPHFDGNPAAIIPGADAFLTAPYDALPTGFSYHRVLSDGTLELVAEAPHWGEYDASPTFALVGWPATHLVTHTGQRLRVDSCFTAAPGVLGSCMDLEPRVADWGTDDTLAMDGSRDGSILAVRAVPRAHIDESPCIHGCRLERTDAASGRLLGHHDIVFPGDGYEVHVRDDPWSGHAVVSTPLVCATIFPNECEGWEVRLEAL